MLVKDCRRGTSGRSRRRARGSRPRRIGSICSLGLHEPVSIAGAQRGRLRGWERRGEEGPGVGAFIRDSPTARVRPPRRTYSARRRGHAAAARPESSLALPARRLPPGNTAGSTRSQAGAPGEAGRRGPRAGARVAVRTYVRSTRGRQAPGARRARFWRPQPPGRGCARRRLKMLVRLRCFSRFALCLGARWRPPAPRGSWGGRRSRDLACARPGADGWGLRAGRWGTRGFARPLLRAEKMARRAQDLSSARLYVWCSAGRAHAQAGRRLTGPGVLIASDLSTVARVADSVPWPQGADGSVSEGACAGAGVRGSRRAPPRAAPSCHTEHAPSRKSGRGCDEGEGQDESTGGRRALQVTSDRAVGWVGRLCEIHGRCRGPAQASLQCLCGVERLVDTSPPPRSAPADRDAYSSVRACLPLFARSRRQPARSDAAARFCAGARLGGDDARRADSLGRGGAGEAAGRRQRCMDCQASEPRARLQPPRSLLGGISAARQPRGPAEHAAGHLSSTPLARSRARRARHGTAKTTRDTVPPPGERVALRPRRRANPVAASSSALES